MRINSLALSLLPNFTHTHTHTLQRSRLSPITSDCVRGVRRVHPASAYGCDAFAMDPCTLHYCLECPCFCRPRPRGLQCDTGRVRLFKRPAYHIGHGGRHRPLYQFLMLRLCRPTRFCLHLCPVCLSVC